MESATCCGMESDQRSEWNHGNAVYGIKPQERCTLARDEIQGRNAPLMIYRLASDDIPSLRLGYFKIIAKIAFAIL